MSVVRWEPIEETVERMRTDMDRLFEGLRFPLTPFQFAKEGEVRMPVVDVEEDGKQVVLTAELPGVSKEHLEVECNERLVSLKAEMHSEREEKKNGHNGRFLRKERQYGAFRRMIELPAPIEATQAKATFKNGLLRVELPKKAMPGEKTVRLQFD